MPWLIGRPYYINAGELVGFSGETAAVLSVTLVSLQAPRFHIMPVMLVMRQPTPKKSRTARPVAVDVDADAIDELVPVRSAHPDSVARRSSHVENLFGVFSQLRDMACSILFCFVKFDR